MISTVTTSTVTSITTMIGFGTMQALIVFIALGVFLSIKKLAATRSSSSTRFLARSLDVGIVPMVIAFAMILAMRVVELL